MLAAAEVFNLTKELRNRIEQILQAPMPVEELLVENLSARDKAFAFVAAAWISGVDADVDEKEQALLEKAASILGLSSERKAELLRVARDLEPLRKGGASWTNEIVTLFRAIPQRLEGEGDYEVAFEG